MKNFTFYNPTKIVFGKNTINKLSQLVPEDVNILITYGGGSVKKFGTLESVKTALSGRKILEFGGIEPNPQYDTLMKAVKIVKEENIGFILAIGGGSVMDGTKFITLASNYDGDNPSDMLFDQKLIKTIKEVIPFGCVVTLPATGSEMNSGGVISKGKDKIPMGSALTYPLFSILDPQLTYTLPKTQVANGIIDTFVHVVEQYVTLPEDARFVDRTAEGILLTLIEIAEKTMSDPTDYDARANLVMCATMGLNGLISSGVKSDWSIHDIGHEITGLYGIDHAKSLAIVLPSLWNIRRDKKHAKLVQYAKRVWNITEKDEEKLIDMAIQKTREFFESLGVKTHLKDYGIEEKDIEEIVLMLERHNKTNISETKDLTLDISRKILQEAL